jgi:hypothetical protein
LFYALFAQLAAHNVEMLANVLFVGCQSSCFGKALLSLFKLPLNISSCTGMFFALFAQLAAHNVEMLANVFLVGCQNYCLGKALLSLV